MNKAWSSYARYTAAAIVVVALLNIWRNATLPIHYDEAYYWWMSKHLALSFFDIPTLLPYLIKLTTLMGDETWQIRMVNIICLSLSSVFLYRLVANIYDSQKAFWVVLFTLCTPFMQLGYTITTTDIPFLFFWTMGIYFAYQVVFRAKTSDFFWLGVALGLGAISKYSMAIAIAALLVYAVLYRRDLFANRKLLISIGVGLLLVSPVLIWNIQNDWASISFRYAYGSTTDYTISISSIANYFGSLFFLFTPVVFLFLFFLPFEKKAINEQEFFILFLAASFLLFFLYKALFTDMAMNWLVPGTYLTMVFVLVRLLAYKKLFFTALFISILLSLVVKIPQQLGLPAEANLNSRLMGYQESMLHMQQKIPTNSLVCGDYYSTSALFRYHAGEDYTVLEPFTERVSDVDFFTNGYQQFNGKSCYALLRAEITSQQREACLDAELIEHYQYSDKRYFEQRDYYLYRCEQLKIAVNGENQANKGSMN